MTREYKLIGTPRLISLAVSFGTAGVPLVLPIAAAVTSGFTVNVNGDEYCYATTDATAAVVVIVADTSLSLVRYIVSINLTTTTTKQIKKKH